MLLAAIPEIGIYGTFQLSVEVYISFASILYPVAVKSYSGPVEVEFQGVSGKGRNERLIFRVFLSPGDRLMDLPIPRFLP